MLNVSVIVPPVKLNVNVPAVLAKSITNSCGSGEYPPEYNVEQPLPCVTDITSMLISNEQRTVGVIVGVGDGVAPIDDVGVIVGDNVGVVVTVGFGVRVIVGVAVFVGVCVGVILWVGVIVGVGVNVAGADGGIIISQSTNTDLDRLLFVQGESNLMVIFLLPTAA